MNPSIDADHRRLERFKITADEAFPLLAKASQQTNRRPSVGAADLAHTGTLGH